MSTNIYSTTGATTAWTDSSHEFGLDARAQHDLELERAPGFSMADIDRACREAYVAGQKAGYAKGRREGYRNGVDEGERRATGAIAGAVTKVLRGRLNHTQRHIAEIARRPKTTIKQDRERIEQMAVQLDADLDGLAAIEGVER